MQVAEPQPDSPTWPIVLQFAKLMEHKLSLNRHKGDREDWLKDSPEALMCRVRDEANECDDCIVIESPLDVALEAADIANFAMMVADSGTNGAFLDPSLDEQQTMAKMGIHPRKPESQS